MRVDYLPVIPALFQHHGRASWAVIRIALFIKTGRAPRCHAPSHRDVAARMDHVQRNFEVLNIRPNPFPLIAPEWIAALHDGGFGAK